MKSRQVEVKNDNKSFRNKVIAVVLGALAYTVLAPTAHLFGTMILIRIAVALGIL